MADIAKPTIKIKMRWWFKYIYMPCLAAFWHVALAIDPLARPDMNKFKKWLMRGTKLRLMK